MVPGMRKCRLTPHWGGFGFQNRGHELVRHMAGRQAEARRLGRRNAYVPLSLWVAPVRPCGTIDTSRAVVSVSLPPAGRGPRQRCAHVRSCHHRRAPLCVRRGVGPCLFRQARLTPAARQG